MPRLLDEVRDLIRVRHYSIRTEEAYVRSIKEHIFFHDKRHPREMGEREVSKLPFSPGSQKKGPGVNSDSGPQCPSVSLSPRSKGTIGLAE